MSLHRSHPARTRRARTARSFRTAALGPVAALVLTLLAPVPASASTCALGGLGTGEQPWEVATAADLALVGQGDCGLDGVYRQTADITLAPGGEAGNHTPIGSSSTPFTGTYDGDGHTITGMTIFEPTLNDVGMFGEIEGIVRDVHLSGISVTGKDRVGGLAGRVQGTGEVLDSSTAGTVTGNGELVGGLIGQHQGSVIRRSSSSATVSGGNRTGGLVGRASGTDIEFSFATGSVSGSAYSTGGLAGEIATTTVIDSYARGKVSGSDSSAGDYVGGLIGRIDTAATITRTFAANVGDPDGIVVAGGSPGGLVGDGIGAATITDSFWDTDTSSVADTLNDRDIDGRETADLKLLTTFVDAGWDIEETCDTGGFDPGNNKVWGICPTINDGYPFLRSISTDQSQSDDSSSGTTGGGTTGGGVSAPVLTGGVLPAQPAGSASWRRADGTSTPLKQEPNGRLALRYASGETSVLFGAAPGTSVEAGVVADANGQLLCEVCADLPVGSVIEVWLFSEPRLIAAHRVTDDDCQTFTIPLATPLDGGGTVATGTHTLQVALPTAAGMEALDVGITVGGPVPTTVPAGEGPAPMPRPLGLMLAAVLTLGLAATARRAVAVRS